MAASENLLLYVATCAEVSARKVDTAIDVGDDERLEKELVAAEDRTGDARILTVGRQEHAVIASNGPSSRPVEPGAPSAARPRPNGQTREDPAGELARVSPPDGSASVDVARGGGRGDTTG